MAGRFRTLPHPTPPPPLRILATVPHGFVLGNNISMEIFNNPWLRMEVSLTL